MKLFFSNRYLILAVFLMLCAPSMPMIAAPDQDAAAQNKTLGHAVEAAILQEYLKIVREISDQSQRQVDKFFSTKNDQPYHEHVHEIGKHVGTMKSNLLEPLKEKVDAAGSQFSGELKQILEKLHTIMAILHTNLTMLHKVLKKQKEPRTFHLASSLRGLQKEIKPSLKTVETEIENLFVLIRTYIQTHNGNRAIILQALELKKIFHLVAHKKSSSLELLSGIKHRVHCKTSRA